MALIHIAAIKDGFLVNSFVKKLQAQGHEAVLSGLGADEITAIETAPDLLFLFSGEGIENYEVSLKALAEKVEAMKFPLFVLTGEEDDAFVRSCLSEEHVDRFVSRPFNVAAAVEEVCDFLDIDNAKERNRILVVDDSGIMLRNIKGWLEDRYCITMCDSGPKALEYLASGERPDLILLDYAMPDMDGSEVLEAIRGNSEYAMIPVIFLTGKNDEESIKKVLRLKTDGYLLKSMPAGEIIDHVDRFFEENIRNKR